jgi:hypothetical protein
MLKREITYTDFFTEQEVTEEFYFNLTEAEIIELEAEYPGGFEYFMKKIINAADEKSLLSVFKKVILMSYGVRVGNNFEKTEAHATAFSSSPAYSALFMEFITKEGAAADFVNGIIPTVEQTDQDKPVGPPPSPLAPPPATGPVSSPSV